MPEQLVTPRLLSNKAAAHYAGVSERTVRRWMAEGLIATHKIDTRRLFEKESLDNFIDRSVRSPALWEGEELAPNSRPLSFAQQVAKEVVRLMREA